jgi:hypothetical protein
MLFRPKQDQETVRGKIDIPNIFDLTDSDSLLKTCLRLPPSGHYGVDVAGSASVVVAQKSDELKNGNDQPISFACQRDKSVFRSRKNRWKKTTPFFHISKKFQVVVLNKQGGARKSRRNN